MHINYIVLERFGNYTLVEFILHTGRTHQIRVHSKYINHPIVCDPVYGVNDKNFKYDGQLLHAYKIEFFHPATNEKMSFLCNLPDDFESVTMKHCKNKKWFALIMNVNNKLYLNVKTDPNYSDILRNTYDYIIPAYHMNKEHWNTIIVDEKVDKTLVKEMIEQSYQLTK